MCHGNTTEAEDSFILDHRLKHISPGRTEGGNMPVCDALCICYYLDYLATLSFWKHKQRATLPPVSLAEEGRRTWGQDDGVSSFPLLLAWWGSVDTSVFHRSEMAFRSQLGCGSVPRCGRQSSKAPPVPPQVLWAMCFNHLWMCTFPKHFAELEDSQDAFKGKS